MMSENYLNSKRPFVYPFETGKPIVVPETIEPVRGARWFQNSFRLSVRHSSSYRMRRLLDFMMAELKTVMRISSPRKTRQVLETLMLNLVESRMADLPVNYSRNKNKYTGSRLYGNGFFKYDRVIPVANALKKLGYINEKGGFRDRDTGDGWETRMWGTPKLWATFEHFSLITPDFVMLTKPEQLVFLRDEDDNNISFRQNGYTQRITADLERYNDLVDGFEISVSLNSDIEVDDEFLTEFLYRNLLNNRITLLQIQLHNQSIIHHNHSIWTPSFLTVSQYPITQLYNQQTTITNTNWRKRTRDLGLQRFDCTRERFLNFLHERAVEYRPQKARERRKEAKERQKKKKYRLKKRRIPRFPLGHFGIQQLEFRLNYEYLYRVFNFSRRFDLGGRAYGALHQILPRHMRPFIRINGQPTVEPDYSAYHILMLYHRQGIDYQDNPYSVCEGVKMRDTYKAVGLVAINAPNEVSAYGGLWAELADMGIPLPPYKQPLKTLVRIFREAHPDISKYLYSGVGLELQNTDGNIMNAILVRLMDKGILGLSVYDSVIVPAQHAGVLKEVMIEEYEKVMKFKPRL